MTNKSTFVYIEPLDRCADPIENGSECICLDNFVTFCVLLIFH